MKKNVLKKFAAAALAAATVMSSMSVMAFAADTETAASTGSVTITKYMGDTVAGDTLSPENYTGVAPKGDEYKLLKDVEFAYVKVGTRVQVETADENSLKTEMQYNVTNNDFLEAIGIKAGVNKNYTQSELNNEVSSSANKTAVIDFVKKNKGTNEEVTDESGTASFTGLDLNALYVFAETDATKAVLASDETKKVNVTKVSVPFLVSLPFTGKDGKTVTELNVYPKNSTGTESIDKNIEGNQKKKTTVANIGDTINYEVEYSIPVTEQGLVKLVVKDTMSKGLTFDKNNIKVKNGETLVTEDNYDVASTQGEEGTTITITFKKEYCKTLDKNTTQNFTITYTATLNKDAVLGQSGNTNSVTVTYQNDKDDEKTTPTTPIKDTKVFTYGIDLLKKGEGTKPLGGVEFKLTDGTNEIKVLKSGDAYYPSNDTKASSTVKTDDKGKIYIRGLKPGTYKLTETKTNAGYVRLKNPVEIVITPSIDVNKAAEGVVSATVGGKEVTMTDDNGSATAKVPLTVVNSKGFDLPATGGRGIALFTIAGIAIVAAAGSLLFMRKRSK